MRLCLHPHGMGNVQRILDILSGEDALEIASVTVIRQRNDRPKDGFTQQSRLFFDCPEVGPTKDAHAHGQCLKQMVHCCLPL